MKLSFLYLSLFLILSTSLWSCKKTRPQLPTNRQEKNEGDRKKKLEEINKSLIVREDSLLKIYIATLQGDYKKNDFGFWHSEINNKEKKTKLKFNDKCRVTYRTYLLDGSLVEKEKELSVVVGRKELISGIDLALELLQKGDSVELIIPWHLAYGKFGKKDLIPPYSSVVCHLRVEEN